MLKRKRILLKGKKNNSLILNVLNNMIVSTNNKKDRHK